MIRVGVLFWFLYLPTLTLTVGQVPFPEIRIYISATQFANLKNQHDTKTNLTHAVMLINGDSAQLGELHDRGNNSLKFQRKSLSVELDHEMKLNNPELRLKKFNLVSLSMDKNFWHNRWANLVLQQQELFPLYNTYCTVWINDVAQGIYLLIEKPTHFRNVIKSPYMLRRGLNHVIQDEYVDAEMKNSVKRYRQQYNAMYATLKMRDESQIAPQLARYLNLPRYYRWMAFNYYVMNGDYSDEVYLWIDPVSGLFNVLPWDFDDILKPAPHEGWAARNQTLADRKVFSMEETFDRAVATHPQLYSDYETILKQVVSELDSAHLWQASKQVLAELQALTTHSTVAQASQFLDRQPLDFNAVQHDITQSMELLLKRRRWILTGK